MCSSDLGSGGGGGGDGEHRAEVPAEPPVRGQVVAANGDGHWGRVGSVRAALDARVRAGALDHWGSPGGSRLAAADTVDRSRGNLGRILIGDRHGGEAEVGEETAAGDRGFVWRQRKEGKRCVSVTTGRPTRGDGVVVGICLRFNGSGCARVRVPMTGGA